MVGSRASRRSRPGAGPKGPAGRRRDVGPPVRAGTAPEAGRPEPGAAAALVEALSPFGFAEYEARAYAALVTRQPATAYEVAKGARIPDSKIYRVLEKLEGRGAVTRVGSDPTTFAALPPAALAAQLEAAARRSLQAARWALARAEARESPVAAWPLEDGPAVLDRAAALLAAAQSRVDLAASGAPLAALAGALAAAQTRGVEVVLAPGGSDPDASGREPLLLVADGAEALVARLGTAPDGRVEGRGLASREPALVEALAELLGRRRADAEASARPESRPRRGRREVGAGGGLGALEAALAPGRLDIC